MSEGLFITFEGIEGSGKSTQLKLLRATLEAQGREVVAVREPGSTPIGNRIRGLLLDPEATDMAAETEMLLFAAARSQLVRQVVTPALDRGAIILCDRYLHSSIAYQGWARALGRETVLVVNMIATKGLLPHRIILMDIDVEVALQRARSRAGLDRIEREDVAFHDTVRQGYLAEQEREPQRFIRINADQSESEIQHQIFEQLAPDLAELGPTS